MKINLLQNICCPEGSFLPGRVELSEKIAKGLVAGGYATEIKTEPIKEIEPEALTIEKAEIVKPIIEKITKKRK